VPKRTIDFDFIEEASSKEPLESDLRPSRSVDRVSNEFATVETSLVEVPGGTLLKLHDIRHGRSIVLDALEVESITRLTHGDFRSLVDPNFIGVQPMRRLESVSATKTKGKK
jgi:hypothetical protein